LPALCGSWQGSRPPSRQHLAGDPKIFIHGRETSILVECGTS
jgi:hypothetical protein